MKKIKLITAVITVLVCVNLVFAANPTKRATDNIAATMVEKLGRDVQLTDSQKTLLLVKAKEFVIKRQSANSQINKEIKITTMKQAHQEYKAILDNLLTNDQKTQLTVKQNERRDAIVNKTNK